MARKMGVSSILLVVAVACFLLVAFGASIARLDLTSIGLAAFAASFFVR